jgi:redox-sensitive bicupin YhaK (pirin superfamily)
VILGGHAGVQSPATVHTPIVGLDLRVHGSARLPLDPEFEHAAIVVDGAASIAGESLAPGELLYLGRGRSTIAMEAAEPARLLLLGGEPFESRIVMWWNFVGRTREEIVEARDAWMHDAGLSDGPGAGRFPAVPGDPAPPIPAPPTPWPAS